MLIATIDGGTTNTRTRIWKDNLIISEAEVAVGVRNTAIDGNNHKLIEAVHNTLYEAAAGSDSNVENIELVLAAGMLTSNVGIREIPHISAPAGMAELASSMVSCIIPEITDRPIWFVPGIKNIADKDNTENNITNMDIMRGEESEAAGLLEYFTPVGSSVLVLPGSHNKYISLDDKQNVLGCMTTMAGEVLHSLTFDTILADSVDRAFARSFDEKAFLRGVDYGKRLGIGHAAFMARILRLFHHDTAEQVRNYLLGLMLIDDWQSLQESEFFHNMRKAVFIVTGNPIMQKAYECLLHSKGVEVKLVSEEMQRGLSGFGAISLAKRRGLLTDRR